MILVAGEALIDLTHHAGAPSFAAHPGGGPYNTAVGLGRLGVPVAFLGMLGDDVFGRMLADRLAAAGAAHDPALTTNRPTTLAIADVDEEGHARYAFYLEGTSAAQLHPGRLPLVDPEVDAIHVGTLGLVLEPTATTVVALVLAEASQRVIAVDPNIRPAVIADMDAHRGRLHTVISCADVVRLSEDDARLLYPGVEPEAAVDHIVGLAPTALVVLSRGGGSVLARHGDTTVERPVPEVEVADTIGAGDSFNAGLLAWLHDRGRLTKEGVATLGHDDVVEAVDFASAVAAVTVTRPGAEPPWLSEL